MRREDRFAMQPNAGWWWMLVAYLPASSIANADRVPEKQRAGEPHNNPEYLLTDSHLGYRFAEVQETNQEIRVS